MNEIKPKSISGIFNNVLIYDPSKEEFYKKLEEEEKLQADFDRKEKLLKHYQSEKSGIRPRFYEESFETFIAESDEQKKNLAAVKNFMSNKALFLLMYGENGNGKTHLASSLIRVLGGIYITSAMLCLEFESGADYNAKLSRLEVIEKYSNADFLVIDEYGRNTSPDLEKKVVSLILSNRYDLLKKTAIVTNENKTVFIESLGKAIFDRFLESCVSCEFKETSKRKDKRDI